LPTAGAIVVAHDSDTLGCRHLNCSPAVRNSVSETFVCLAKHYNLVCTPVKLGLVIQLPHLGLSTVAVYYQSACADFRSKAVPVICESFIV
jgi:hypothetical protein